MVQRDVFLHEPPNPPRTPTRLGGVAAVMASLPKTVTLGGETFRIVDISGQLMAHSTLCPHMQGPLDVEPLQGSEVTCPWHGYRFDLRTGHSCDGRKLQLRPAPIVVIDREKNEVRLEWPATPAS